MRLLRFLVTYAVVSVLGVIVFMFLALNHYTVSLDVFGPEYSVNVALLMVGAAAIGFVTAAFLIIPGRIASGFNVRRLEREAHYLEQDLVELQELRARLLARHDYLVEGHERILLRYHSLLSDHSRVVAERDDAREELAEARAARPIAAAAGRSSSTPLRLLAPASSAPAQVPTPMPAPRPAVQQPAAHVSPQVADAPRVERREAQPEPPRVMKGALLPAPVGFTDVQPRQVPVTSVSISEIAAAPPEAPAAPAAMGSPEAQETIPESRVRPPTATTPARQKPAAQPRQPLAQPAAFIQRARQGVASQGARVQVGLAARRDEIQQRVAVLSGQVRPHVAAFRATVEAQATQLRERLTPVTASGSADDEGSSQAPEARVASASHPLGE